MADLLSQGYFSLLTLFLPGLESAINSCNKTFKSSSMPLIEYDFSESQYKDERLLCDDFYYFYRRNYLLHSSLLLYSCKY